MTISKSASPMFRDSAQPVDENRVLETQRAFMRTAESLPALFDLSVQEITLLSDLTVAYGQDVDPTDEDAVQLHNEAVARLEAEFAGNEALIVRKVERYIHVIEKQTMMVEGFKARAKQLRDHASAIENGQAWLKQRLLVAMKLMERTEVSTPSGIVSIRQNNPHADILNEPPIAHVEAYESMPGVPPEYVRLITLYRVDKRAILAAAKQGEVIPGVEVSRTERVQLS